MDKEILKFGYPTGKPSIIKVIGVGGGGGNAVTHMFREGIKDVNFVLCNTDNQALQKSEVPVKILLGQNTTGGLGSGNRPEKARLAAEESTKEIESLLSDGTKMVFITAGMGGGTGTGSAPVIAKIAKKMDILTVGIVTIPFVFEGIPKILQALEGVKKMEENVDALLVINNERLLIHEDGETTVKDAFKKADNTLTEAAKSIAETITVPGDINLDFADVHTILKDGGVAIMSSGIAFGQNRILTAIEKALQSPLLSNSDYHKAKKILFNIVYSSNTPLLIGEMREIRNFMTNFSTFSIEVIWGTAIDESLDKNVRIIVLASGFGTDAIKDDFLSTVIENEEIAKMEKAKELIDGYYGDGTFETFGKKIRPKPHIFTLEELDNNEFIELVINNPAYNRDARVLTKQK